MPGRPRKIPVFPEGLREGQPVKVTSSEFKGPKLGIIIGLCRYDNGILVKLTNPRYEGISEIPCIQTEKGDTIEGIEK